jgi:DNA-binding transcriptional LysR family regulator
METNRLKQFCVIVESGSLSRAAELLHITHSALSKSMGVLQRELNAQLLQPSGRGIAVTETGKRIYNKAKQFLAREQELFFSQAEESSTEIRIGTVEVFNSLLVRGYSQMDLKEKSIKILDIEPGQMEHQIVQGHLDFAVTYLPMAHDQIRSIALKKFKLGCYHRADVFKNQDFGTIPFVTPAKVLPENPRGIKERDGWPDALHPRQVKFRTNLLSVAMDIVSNGAAAIIIPHFVAQQFNTSQPSTSSKLIERHLPSTIQLPIQTTYVLCHAHRVEDHHLRTLCKLLRQ